MPFIKPGVDGTGGRCHTPAISVAMRIFFNNRLVESMLFRMNHIRLELFGRGRQDDRARELRKCRLQKAYGMMAVIYSATILPMSSGSERSVEPYAYEAAQALLLLSRSSSRTTCLVPPSINCRLTLM